MKQEYYVAMHIDGVCVPSSAVKNGNLTTCRATVKSLSRTSANTVSWHIYKCVGVVDTPANSRLVQ